MANKRQAEFDKDLTPVPRKALVALRRFIAAYYGDRCRTRAHGCKCCQMWALYDAFELSVDA